MAMLNSASTAGRMDESDFSPGLASDRLAPEGVTA